jgi:chromosome segregation ATPase
VQEQNEVLRNENSRLEYQTREAREIENEIKQIQSERDDLERTITNIISGPFMRKEGQSMQQRMAELEHKVKEKSSLAAKLHEECMKKKDAADKAEQELNKLRGQRDYLAGEHKQATEEFKQKHATNQNARQPNSFDTVVALHNTDQSKYNTMMDDLRQNHTETGAAPAWANLPFLDRMPANAHTDPKQQLQEEIKALQMEKSSFAQELEKAQNLLKLQTDIEKENTQYF